MSTPSVYRYVAAFHPKTAHSLTIHDSSGTFCSISGTVTSGIPTALLSVRGYFFHISHTSHVPHYFPGWPASLCTSSTFYRFRQVSVLTCFSPCVPLGKQVSLDSGLLLYPVNDWSTPKEIFCFWHTIYVSCFEQSAVFIEKDESMFYLSIKGPCTVVTTRGLNSVTTVHGGLVINFRC